MTKKAGFLANPRDEWSFKTHALGFVMAVIATVCLIIYEISIKADTGTMVTSIIFGFSMMALYLCSSIYHYSIKGPEVVVHLRKLDHSMIYVLIAGTYTPIIQEVMKWPKNLAWMIGIWTIAAVGIIIKMFWLNAPRWLYTSLYILMGWAIIFDYRSLLLIPGVTIFWLALGGVAYTIGAVFYMLKKPNPFPGFGFHEIFHVFIILGTAFQFVAVLRLVQL